MALRLRPKVSSVGSPFLQLGSSATAFAFSQACSVPNLGFQPVRLQRKKYLSPTTFFVRASRTESKGVTLGFRAPQFEVFNFPSLHIFFFVFFETWNGVIIICFIYLFLDGLKLYQLPEPLTGKVWTLEDFEAYPALLVRCHLSSFFLPFVNFVCFAHFTDSLFFLCYVCSL